MIFATLVVNAPSTYLRDYHSFLFRFNVWNNLPIFTRLETRISNHLRPFQPSHF